MSTRRGAYRLHYGTEVPTVKSADPAAGGNAALVADSGKVFYMKTVNIANAGTGGTVLLINTRGGGEATTIQHEVLANDTLTIEYPAPVPFGACTVFTDAGVDAIVVATGWEV